MTGQIAYSLAAALIGSALGAVYVALLWASVRALARPRPVAGFAALAAVRAIVVLGALGAALASGAGPGALLSALTGFTALRIVATRVLGRAGHGGPTWT